MDTEQRALAAEIRAEMASRTPRITGKEIQAATGISSSAWNNYFVQCERDVPMSIIIAVAGQLGMKGSELLAKAEARAKKPPTLSEHVAAQLSPEAQEGVKRGRAIVAGRKAKRREAPH